MRPLWSEVEAGMNPPISLPSLVLQFLRLFCPLKIPLASVSRLLLKILFLTDQSWSRSIAQICHWIRIFLEVSISYPFSHPPKISFYYIVIHLLFMACQLGRRAFPSFIDVWILLSLFVYRHRLFFIFWWILLPFHFYLPPFHLLL